MIVLAALSASLILAAAPDAALEPSPPADIAAAVSACWQAVIPGAVDRAHLGRDGWSRVAATADPAVSPLQAFVKAGAQDVILVTDDERAKDYCTVIARLASQDDLIPTLKAVKERLQAADPGVTAERTEGGMAFVSLPRFAQVDPTDAAGSTKDKPAIRIMVGYKMAEQK